ALGELLASCDTDLAMLLMKMLAEHKSRAALEGLRGASASPHQSVRLRAIEARASIDPTDVVEDISALLDADDPRMRTNAIRIVGAFKVGGVSAQLATQALDKRFNDYGETEKQSLLQLIWELDHEEGERVCIQLTRKSLLPDQKRDATRRIAIELLGARGTSQAALDAVMAATKRGFGNSRELRESGMFAAVRLNERMTESFGDE
ncbi:MAG: HEAT repeat domain-containing protein, partial [Myxococcales bacterium]|nr:HEAT repeat domain-containing protein [Myxococcales bacterium]